MNKPNNYDEVRESGAFTPVELGGHHLIIKQVNETKSKAGNSMIVVLFDMAKNDKQAGYMANEFENDIRADKKWPHAGTVYILTEDSTGNCSRKFKTFISCFEKSNNCEATWGDTFTKQFKNKKIGGVFGEVENEYNGKVTMRHELRYFCSDDAVDKASIPQAQMLNKTETAKPTSPAGFMNIPEGAEDELPF